MSIGLAVYNGERYLATAIESILGQSFDDFELIVSDNASTDRTAEICEGYAASDPRIRFHRNARNIGGVNNENLTMELARGEYFRLAAHDDVCEPDLLKECVAALDARPDAVLAYTDIVAIDEHARVLRTIESTKGTQATAHERFACFPFRDHGSEATYGLMRLDVVRSVRPQGSYGHGDRVWLAELALRGPFVIVHRPLFRKRFHEKNAHKDIRARVLWFHPDFSGKVTLPHWREWADYWIAVRLAPVPRGEKLRCVPTIVRWTFKHSKNLAKDVAVAVWCLLGLRRLGEKPSELNWQ